MSPSPTNHHELETNAILQWFTFSHLPAELQPVSRKFAELADFVATLPPGFERNAALRKLLEAKDCAVRQAKARVES